MKLGLIKTGELKEEVVTVSECVPEVAEIHGKEEERAKIEELFKKFADVFAKDEFDLGKTTEFTHTIELTDNTPIRQPYRRIPHPYINEAKRHLQKLLNQKIILLFMCMAQLKSLGFLGFSL